MKRLYVFLAAFIVFTIIFLYAIKILPVVYIDEFEMPKSEFKSIKGERFNPIEKLNNQDNIEIYLYIAPDEMFDLPNGIIKYGVLYTKDKQLIKRLINNFSFIYKEGDMTSCQSIVSIKKYGRTVFQSHLVVDKNYVGLQNSAFGWVESVNYDELLNIFKEFTPLYTPIKTL